MTAPPAIKVFEHVCFLAKGNPGFVNREDVLRHFRLQMQGFTSEETDEVLRSLSVSGFVSLLVDYVLLTGKRFPGSQVQIPGYERPAPPPMQVRALPGVVIGADDDKGIMLCAGPGANGWDPNNVGADDTAAYFAGDELEGLRHALDVVARQARFGREYELTVDGSDLGDVRLATQGNQVRMTVVPYGWGRETFDEEQGDPAADVPVDYDDDETGETRLFSAAEREAMIADARREHEQRWNAVVAARPDLTTLIAEHEVDRLLAALQPGEQRPPPAGVPDVG